MYPQHKLCCAIYQHSTAYLLSMLCTTLYGATAKPSCGCAGGYLSIVSGLLYDATAEHHRWGPRATLLAGAALNTIGYAALWAAAAG